MKSANDYKSFQPEFTKKSQLIAKLVKDGIIDEQGNLKKPEKTVTDAFAGNPQAQEAVRILQELGFVTKPQLEAFQKQLNEFQEGYQSRTASAQLDSAVKTLTEKYAGKHGEPPFKLDEIRAAVEKDPSLTVYVQGESEGEYLVDLEQTYRKVHAGFYDKFPEIKAKVLKTERGSQVQTTPGTRKKAETEEERTAQAVEFFKNNSSEE